MRCGKMNVSVPGMRALTVAEDCGDALLVQYAACGDDIFFERLKVPESYGISTPIRQPARNVQPVRMCDPITLEAAWHR